MRPRTLATTCALVAAALVTPARAVIPETIPDIPVLGAMPVMGGGLRTTPGEAVTPAPKTVDGRIDDWTGTASRLGGTGYYSRGEYVWQDYVMDDWGADDGQDAARTQHTDAATEAEPRAFRTEALAQAAGDQFDAPGPETVSAQVHYGDVEKDAHGDQADIEEVRVAADAERLYFLVRTVGMTSGDTTAVFVGLRLGDADLSFVATPGGVRGYVYSGAPAMCVTVCTDFDVAVDPGSGSDAYRNAFEISVDRAFLDALGPPVSALAVGSGIADGLGLAQLRQGDAQSDLVDVLQVESRPSIWMDHDQALALHAGDVDRWLIPVDLSKLESGYDETFEPLPGYYERIYVSDSPVNREVESNSYFQGAFQHYGLYLPTTYRPGRLHPATWWTHYRGGHAHDAAAWVPGLIRQLGEQMGNIVITPGARGTSSWYVGRGHEDFLEAWDDAMTSFPIDPDRVYLSGYSMGGFASWLLGFLYPDRWAGAFPTAGPPTQGLWDGLGLVTTGTNDGRPQAQLTFNILENARNVPYAIYHGTNDELVPYSGIARMASRFAELGYRFRLYTFPGAEHYTLAIYDEWTEAARYLNGFRRDPNPARVTYKVWPALEQAVEQVQAPEGAGLDYSFDGAYWVDALHLRAGDASDVTAVGSFDATTYGRGVEEVIGVPEAGTAGQVMPHVMTGSRWHHAGRIPPRNEFEVALGNIDLGTLDLARMGISSVEQITARVTTDGPTTLTLTGRWLEEPTVSGAGVTAVVDGTTTLRITFPTGATTVTIAP